MAKGDSAEAGSPPLHSSVKAPLRATHGPGGYCSGPCATGSPRGPQGRGDWEGEGRGRKPRASWAFSSAESWGYGAFGAFQCTSWPRRPPPPKRGRFKFARSKISTASALRASAGGAKPRIVVGVGGCYYPRFYLRADCHPLPNSAAGEMESGWRPYERRAISIPAPSNEHCDIRVTGRRRARKARPV